MAQRVAIGVLVAITVIYAAFMGRILFDDNFRPPPQIGVLGPLLLTSVTSFLFTAKRNKQELDE